MQVEEAGLTLVQKYVRHSRKHEHGDKTFMRPEKVVANGVHYVDVLEESGEAGARHVSGLC